MKKKAAAGTVPFACALLLVLCAAAVGRAPSPAFAEDDYYAEITAEGGNELLGQLHDLITVTHTHYTTYPDCKNPDYVRRTDPGPNGELAEFYTQAELSSVWEKGIRGTWNREHVWCQSLSNGLWGESGGGSDLLHIRPTESSINSTRQNMKYGEVEGGSEAWTKDKQGARVALGGHFGGDTYEPIDSVKGDVARIVLYVYTHYNTFANVYGSTDGQGARSYFGTLHFTDVVAAKTEQSALAILLSWNSLDKVDALEQARNEAAEDIQGNRNPFVDHPEYAEAIWGGGGGGEEDAEVSAFRTAVSEIVTEGSLSQRLSSLNRAIRAYHVLNEEQKTTAASLIARLEEAIEAYNAAVHSYNLAADAADRAALGGAGVVLGGGQAPSGRQE